MPDILAGLGLGRDDLRVVFEDIETAANHLAEDLGAGPPMIWRYQNTSGEDVLAVVRVDAAGGKTYRPYAKLPDGWRIGDPPDLLPLYRLPSLTGHERIFVVEGEKCADALWRLGLPATTSAHGAKSPHKTDWSPLAGRDVVLLPDADEAGRNYAQVVASILRKLND